jgi:hypothetical protein
MLETSLNLQLVNRSLVLLPNPTAGTRMLMSKQKMTSFPLYVVEEELGTEVTKINHRGMTTCRPRVTFSGLRHHYEARKRLQFK